MTIPENAAVVNLLLYLYTIECFLYVELNKASKHADESKVDNLGPYACVLEQILFHAPHSRTDIDVKQISSGI